MLSLLVLCWHQQPTPFGASRCPLTASSHRIRARIERRRLEPEKTIEERRRKNGGAKTALLPISNSSAFVVLSTPLPYLTPFLPLALLSFSLSKTHSYGYDPLGLGKDAEGVEKYRAAELIHARWAMLGAAGSIIPEGLQANGAELRGATWFDAPFELANTGSLTYFAVPWGIITNPLPLAAVAAINVALIAAVERYRATGEGPAGYSPGVGKFDSSIFDGLDPLYPGGPFDPLGLADDPETFEELKVKEIKNGRLAMGKRFHFSSSFFSRFFFSEKLRASFFSSHNHQQQQPHLNSTVSILGFWIQSLVTGEGPYTNFSKHIADPFGNNLLTVVRAAERAPTL